MNGLIFGIEAGVGMALTLALALVGLHLWDWASRPLRDWRNKRENAREAARAAAREPAR